jgi:sRNA-binding regulator protein Hfq
MIVWGGVVMNWDCVLRNFRDKNEPVEIVLNNGHSFRGKIIEIDDGFIRLDTGTVISADAIASVGPPQKPITPRFVSTSRYPYKRSNV